MKDFIAGVFVCMGCVLVADGVMGFYNAKFTDSEARCLKAKANFPEYSFKLVSGICVWEVSPSVYNLFNDARSHRLLVIREDVL